MLLGEMLCIRLLVSSTIRILVYTAILLLFLLAEPLMKVHVVNFIKSLLVKDAFVPKLIKMCIKLLGIIITNKLLDVIQFFIAFDAGKHIKQIELRRVENSWLYVFHNINDIVSRCKDKQNYRNNKIKDKKIIFVYFNDYYQKVVRVSKNDQGMFSQCREIAMKVAEELGNASLQRE